MATAAQTLEHLLKIGCEIGASDLHLDPMETYILVRMRIDGSLQTLSPLSKRIHDELISRIKVLSGLRTDQHLVPQDGRFHYVNKDGGRIDIRLSIAPTYYGENVVLRFLNPSRYDLKSLHLSETHEKQLRDFLLQSHGMLLISGPTGSGKTTTLYSLLRLLEDQPLSLVTIEDPIEYSIEGAVQMETRKGFTFADGLRCVLRQDPDVIMVGEIRDEETAGLATNAALTGHLVLSTVHANDAVSVLLRLLDLKVEPFLIASTVSLVIAQRLVRRVCSACNAQGCGVCDQSGYHGRIPIYEVLEVTEEIRQAILERRSAERLRALIKSPSLLDDGLSKVALGLTTSEEILRSTYA